jgi:hypothetical protein
LMCMEIRFKVTGMSSYGHAVRCLTIREP